MREIDERDCRYGLADTEQTEIEKLRNSIRELEAKVAALRQQQGEPVAWRYKMNRAHSAWTLLEFPPAGLPKGAVVEELYREVAPEPKE